ncbi:MAG: hypothetical protein EOO88_43810 [Pedobacter sp.]|nr:MAG: hypothetical protein EOO88_43810 [Pedobacter sp.]
MTGYEILFPMWWDWSLEKGYITKGYFDVLKVQKGDAVYPVHFVTTAYLTKELKVNKERGINFWSKTNMIIIESVSLADIVACLNKLNDSFFETD